MTSNSHCQYLPSMGAISPVTNLLADLPMVQPKSIPYGMNNLKTDLCYQEPSSHLSHSIAQALSATDTSWIRLKPGLGIPTTPPDPSPSDPPLIRAILSERCFSPHIHIQKNTPQKLKESAKKTERPGTDSKPAKRQMKSPVPLMDNPSPIRTATPTEQPQVNSNKKPGRKRNHSQNTEQKGTECKLERQSPSNIENIAPLKGNLPTPPASSVKPTDLRDINISLGRLKVTRTELEQSLSQGEKETGGVTPLECDTKISKGKKKSKPRSYESEFKVRDARESEELVNEQALHNFKILVERLLELESKYSGLRRQLMGDDLRGECLLPVCQLEQLSTESWKLGRAGLMSRLPTEDLLSALSCMQRHISDAQGIDLGAVSKSSGSPAEGKKWRALSVERICRATEAAQIILAMSGGSGLGPAMVVEEVLESVLEHTRFHLVTNIYPEMDPSYRSAPLEQEEEAPSEFVIQVGGKVSKQRGGKTKKVLSLAKWDLTPLYYKLAELLESMSVLVRNCSLTDTLVLLLSSLALRPFFVENNSTLQLSALKLARNIFSKYPKHRDLIFDEIFLSLSKLPSSKRAIRTYYLEPQSDKRETCEETPEKSIQMVTALVMQLLQSIAAPPREISHFNAEDAAYNGRSIDAHLLESMDEVIKTGQAFLSTLFKKCYSTAPSKAEVDFRPIFESFLQDLLTTLPLPKWPVSHTLLSILCRFFLFTFTSKQADLQMRLAALEHVGTIISQCRCQMSCSQGDGSSPTSSDTSLVAKLIRQAPEEVKSKILSSLQLKECLEIEADSQFECKALSSALLLLHLREREEDTGLTSFWVASWLKELSNTAEKDKSTELSEYQLTSPGLSASRDQALKEFYVRLLTDSDPFKAATKLGYKVTPPAASCIIRFLTTQLPLLQNFSFYLNQLMRMVNETNVQIRTRAMKSLTSVLSVDPTLIGSSDLKVWIRTRMCDMSSMVRESTVDLVGRSLQQRPELATEFHDILSDRMLDTSVAVRKRVIRILRDSIHKMETSVHTDLCVKLVMRIQDEQSVQALIIGMFQDLWFGPLSPGDKEEEKRRAQSISSVVFELEEEPGFNMVQELFTLLLKPDNKLDQQKIGICRRIIDSLMESVLQLDEQGASLAKMIPMYATLHVLSQIDGSLLVSHLTALQPYLTSNCSTQGELIGLTHLLKAFSNALPLLANHKPGPQFLASTEEHLLKLSIYKGSMIVEASLACLAALVNNVTQNFKIVQDCFSKFFDVLEMSHAIIANNLRQNPQMKQVMNRINRSLFTLGLLCRYFDIDRIVDRNYGVTLTKRVFSELIYFAKLLTLPECQEKSLVGLGFFFLAHPSLMLEDVAVDLYSDCLRSSSVGMKCQVLTNLTRHLQEDEERLKRADKDWKRDEKDEVTLQDIGDKQSTLSSTMIQKYLPSVLDAFYTPEPRVRSHITCLLSMVLRQGLIYPAPCIPCLIAMSTDSVQAISVKAESLLEEMNQGNKLMLHTQIVVGIRRSFDFLEVLLSGGGLVRGREGAESRLRAIYSMVHSNRQQRRAFLLAMFRSFDDIDKQGIPFLLYIADNLANFSYSLLGEVLFVIHHISVHLSMAGPALIDAFRESMGLWASSQQTEQLDESAMLNTEAILLSQTCDDSRLATCVYHSYAIIILLHLSAYLKSLYSLTESKCHEYTPNAPAKAYDKPISRKVTAQTQTYEPTEVIEALELSEDGKPLLRSRAELLHRFQEFYKIYKQLEVDGADCLPDTYQHSHQTYHPEQYSEPSELPSASTDQLTKKVIVREKESPAAMKAPKKKSSKVSKSNKTLKQPNYQNAMEKRTSCRSKKKMNYFESSGDSPGCSSNEEF